MAVREDQLHTQAPSTTRDAPVLEPVKNPLELIGLLRSIDRDMTGVIRKSIEQCGDLFIFTLLGKQSYMVIHPEHLHELLVDKASQFAKGEAYTNPERGLARFLGEGLLTSNGEFWRRQRRLIAPALHVKRIGNYVQMMLDETLERISHWRDGETLDIDHEMMQTTLHIVTRTLFHIDISADAARIAEAMTAMQIASASGNSISALIPAWVPTPQKARALKATRDLDEIVYGLIRQWHLKEEDTGDLLSMLLLAETEDGQRMTDKQARDEVVTMFVAGHETTANTLNWTWILLSQHQEIEARLHAELDSVLAGRPPTMEDLRQLPYTEQVIKESMRLYPAAFAFSRVALEDTTIGGYHIPAGAVMQALIWITHTDERWWGDATAFRPERFAPENAGHLVRYAYLPFGGGPRVCIGSTFALMEAQLMLATIASRYRLRIAPGQRIGTAPMLTLRPKYGLKMQVERRG